MRTEVKWVRECAQVRRDSNAKTVGHANRRRCCCCLSPLQSSLHPHNELLSQTQTVTSSETTYGGGEAVMHCESTLLQSALSIVYGKEHDVVQPRLLYRHEGKKQH